MQRRKPHVVKQKTEDYRVHLKRLESIIAGRRHLRHDTHKMEALLQNSHKIHKESLTFQFRRRKMLQTLTPRANLVESIVKKTLQNHDFSVPSRHPPNLEQIKRVNNILVNKLLHVKSDFNFRETPQTLRHYPLNLDADCSRLYENSLLFRAPIQKLHLSIGKFKCTRKIAFKLGQIPQLLATPRDKDAPFVVIFKTAATVKRSKQAQLVHILNAQVSLQINVKSLQELTLFFCEIEGEKQIPRFYITIHSADFQNVQWDSEVKNNLGKKIASVSMIAKICEKKKRQDKESKQNNTFLQADRIFESEREEEDEKEVAISNGSLRSDE